MEHAYDTNQRLMKKHGALNCRRHEKTDPEGSVLFLRQFHRREVDGQVGIDTA